MVMGFALSFIFFLIVGYVIQHQKDNSIQYLEEPVSYENKHTATFRVEEIPFSDAALAREQGNVGYYKTVLLIGKDFYSNQTITINNPQRVGTYSYEVIKGVPKTVPIIVEGDINVDMVEETSDQTEGIYDREERMQLEKQESFHPLEHPENYEGKKTASFEVFKVVLDGYALAREESNRYSDGSSVYFGKTVLLTGSDFYKGMVVTVKNPQRIGSYRHDEDIVPVIETERK